MEILFVSGIIIVNLFVYTEYSFIAGKLEQVWGMNKFMHNATNGKIMQVF